MTTDGLLALGIIGYGRIGRAHAEWLKVAKGIAAVAVFDPTPARRALAGEDGLRPGETIEALLDDPALEAVLVSTPTAMHFEHAALALRAGKHVLIEKPMTLDAAQALQLVELAERHRRVLSVFHCRRWDLDYLTIRQAIATGIFGKLINVESRLGQWASCVGPAAKEWRPGWRNEASFGGGGLYDWGSHFIDQLWQMMLPARPVRVFAQLRGNVWSSDCDDLARICVDFDSGAVGMVEINTTTTRPLPRWHIDGTLGSADSPFDLGFDLREWAKITFAPADGGPPRMLPAAGEVVRPLSEVAFWEQFAAAVRGDGEPAVTARSVLPTMRLLDAARESARLGSVVSVSDDTWAAGSETIRT